MVIHSKLGIAILFFAAITWIGCSEDVPPGTNDLGGDSQEEVEDSSVEPETDVEEDSQEETTIEEDTIEEVTDVPTEIEGCNCGENEICISNEEVTDTCFARDCPSGPCGEEEVCFEGICVGQSCAGIVCDGEFMVCRGGVCILGSCDDPDVECDHGFDCIENVCVKQCLEQSECEGLACIEGNCLPCDSDFQCEIGSICISEACVAPCTEEPTMCTSDEVCNPETGRCIEGCTSDQMCVDSEICDFDSGMCLPQECTQVGETDECEEGHICLQSRCVPSTPLFYGQFSSGGGESTTSRYIGQFIFAPVCLVGPVSESDTYILQTGVIPVLSE